jgi:hypothetical protein
MAVLADAAACGPFPAGHASGSGRLRCRLSSRPLPQRPHNPAAVAGVHRGRPPAGCRCPQATSAVVRFGPPMSAGCADLAATQGRPRNRTPRQCPRCVWKCGRVLTGRPLCTVDTAAAPLSRAGIWRPPVADRPCTPRRRRQWTPTAACGVCGDSRTSTRAAVQTRVSAARRAAAACGHCGSVGGASGTAAAWRWCPDGWGPPRTPPPPAGVRSYRKRSPDRWSLNRCCSHRRYARAS